MRSTLLKGLIKKPLTEPAPDAGDEELARLAGELERSALGVLGRSLSIRHVDAGSCNACELETHALANVFYDLERFGLRFVASPRHADVLLVTGPITCNMREALRRTYDATPAPKWVVAAVVGGASSVVPVDLTILGCPPTPTQLLKGLLALLTGGR
jgi:Ni,Fe-hydrogenase III small subunit